MFTGATWHEFKTAGAGVSGFRESRWNTVQKVKDRTALMWAAEKSRYPEIITILLNAGADAKLESKSGKTAVEYAEMNPVLLGTKQYKALNRKSL